MKIAITTDTQSEVLFFTQLKGPNCTQTDNEFL